MDLLQSNKTITVKLREFNELLTCYLCKGYWIRPTTIAECLHTCNWFHIVHRYQSKLKERRSRYPKDAISNLARNNVFVLVLRLCRSCIVQYLDDSDENECPRCCTVIHETNPLEMLRADQTLEDIIFKLVPHLQESEKQRENNFNHSQKRKKVKGFIPDDELDKQPAHKRQRGSQIRDQCNDHRNDPQIAFCLDCINNDEVSNKHIQPLAKKFIRTSIRLTIGHLKKYLRLKLNLPNKKEVDILCNGEIMGKDHTLEFIHRTRWRLKSEHLLTLHYRSQEVLLS